jgi:hypothetical protein
MAIHTSPIKESKLPYFTIGPAGTPEHRNFTVSTIEDKTHVIVFITQQSATEYRDQRLKNQSVNDWESLKELAVKMQEGLNDVPFIYLEQPAGTDPAFQSMLIDDLLK